MRVAFEHAQLDSETRALEREGQRVAIEPKVFDLLVYLIEHRERVVSSDELLDALWPGVSVGPAAISGAIRKARQAVGDDGERQAVLRTVHGRGFQFVAEISDVPTPEGAPAPRRVRARRIAGARLVALLFATMAVVSPPHPGSDLPPPRSIAVLPFVNLSADPDQGYFADGITEDLLNTLGHFHDLRVTGRTSSFSFRNSDADLRTIGSKLGVEAILEGSVRTEANRVRITAQLVDAQDGFNRWSESYERELEDIFAIQTEIATAIATELRIELSAEQRQRIATPPTRNLAAYQAYLLGRARQASLVNPDMQEAIRYYEQAIDLDPNLALAYAGLTYCYLEQFQDSDLPPDEALERAQTAAERALELDDRLSEAHAALGAVRWWKNDLEGAETAFQRALALNPNSVDANVYYGNLLAVSLDRYEEARVLLRKAVELDPLSTEAMAQLAQALHGLGRFDESLAWLKRAIEVEPKFSYGHIMISMHHALFGRFDEAVVWGTKAVALDPRSPWALAHLGGLFLGLGDVDRAEYWIQRSMAAGAESFYPSVAMQALALYRGDEKAALEHGRKAFAIWPRDGRTLTLLRDHEIRAGRYREARALYEELSPELLHDPEARIDRLNYPLAIDLAAILLRTGEPERAGWLLDRSLQQIRKMRRLGGGGYGLADVQIFALQGRKQEALASLRKAVDQGFRFMWWYDLQQKPDLAPLHAEPEFQAMLAEIRADMATQLEHVREMERRGELASPPEPPTQSLAGAGTSPRS